MKHRLLPAVALIAATVGVAFRADAQTTSSATAPQWAFNVAATSDYVFRGVSQTQENPAISGGVDVTAGAVYAGTWASNVDYGDATDAELDLYFGVRPEFAGFDWDFGIVGYLYPGQPDGADYDYLEVKAAASRAVGPATVGAAVFHTPDYQGANVANDDDEATYAELNGAISPAPRWTVSGAVGRQWLTRGRDYGTWTLGAAYQLTANLAVDVRYHDTDAHAFGDVYGNRAVAALKATF